MICQIPLIKKPIPTPKARILPKLNTQKDFHAQGKGRYTSSTSPAEFLTHTNNIAQFEFDVDQISIAGALFGLVYRYVVRRDNNPQLRQGVVGAFAITRTVATVRVSSECLAVPLRCGPPLSYLDYAMLGQLASGLIVSGVAFAAAAAAVDAGVDRGWLKRFP